MYRLCSILGVRLNHLSPLPIYTPEVRTYVRIVENFIYVRMYVIV